MYASTFLGAVSFFAAGTQAICGHNTHLLPRDDPSPQFTYSGLTGPLNWYSLNVNNSLCSIGSQQTPINLNEDVFLLPGSDFVLNYPATRTAMFENLGTTVEVLGDTIGGTLAFEGKTYNLKQFHFHVPSEHRIEDEFFPVEVHFVHSDVVLGLAVVGFVIEIGAQNDPLLNKVLPFVDSIPLKGDEIQVGPLNFNNLVRGLNQNTVYRYKGSLTTPPCSQNVEWIVSKNPLTINYLTFNKLKKILKFNSRYTQNTIDGINLLENAKNTIVT